MTMQTSTLRPGLLVSLKTSVRGNVSYQRRDLAHKRTKDGKDEAKWETERVIADADEYRRAGEVRTQARIAISRPCAYSAFGLLCPEDRANDLEEAIVEARKIADEFNADAKLTRVSVYVITGRIAQDDVEAVRAINSEVRELLDTMQTGLKNFDAKAVREAANKAVSVGKMLSDDANDKIQIAIDAARSAARRIVKAGDQVSMEIDTQVLKTIKRQRTAFLDIDTPTATVAKPTAKRRAVDLAPQAD